MPGTATRAGTRKSKRTPSPKVYEGPTDADLIGLITKHHRSRAEFVVVQAVDDDAVKILDFASRGKSNVRFLPSIEMPSDNTQLCEKMQIRVPWTMKDESEKLFECVVRLVTKQKDSALSEKRRLRERASSANVDEESIIPEGTEGNSKTRKARVNRALSDLDRQRDLAKIVNQKKDTIDSTQREALAGAIQGKTSTDESDRNRKRKSTSGSPSLSQKKSKNSIRSSQKPSAMAAIPQQTSQPKHVSRLAAFAEAQSALLEHKSKQRKSKKDKDSDADSAADLEEANAFAMGVIGDKDLDEEGSDRDGIPEADDFSDTEHGQKNKKKLKAPRQIKTMTVDSKKASAGGIPQRRRDALIKKPSKTGQSKLIGGRDMPYMHEGDPTDPTDAKVRLMGGINIWIHKAYKQSLVAKAREPGKSVSYRMRSTIWHLFLYFIGGQHMIAQVKDSRNRAGPVFLLGGQLSGTYVFDLMCMFTQTAMGLPGPMPIQVLKDFVSNKCSKLYAAYKSNIIDSSSNNPDNDSDMDVSGAKDRKTDKQDDSEVDSEDEVETNEKADVSDEDE